MKFDTYQTESKRTAMETANPDVTSEFDKRVTALFLAVAINGEAGELAEKAKKYVREDDDEYLAKAEKELGDILWYWSQMVSLLDCNASAVAEQNLDKLQDRQERDSITGQGDDR